MPAMAATSPKAAATIVMTKSSATSSFRLHLTHNCHPSLAGLMSTSKVGTGVL